jgi:hypothetical protein
MKIIGVGIVGLAMKFGNHISRANSRIIRITSGVWRSLKSTIQRGIKKGSTLWNKKGRQLAAPYPKKPLMKKTSLSNIAKL